MDGETPSLPVTGEWTVGHHPYRLPLPAFAALSDRPPPGPAAGLHVSGVQKNC
jgi:hypothetical protein